MGEIELLVGLTARLAATSRLEELVEVIAHELVTLGFGAVWIAILDEESGKLTTVRDVIEGAVSPRPYAREIALDTRQPLGRAFRERRVINIADPSTLQLSDEDAPAGDRMVLPRAVHGYLRGRPFACGPTLGSRGQPVGALVLSSYRGDKPIPDSVLAHGLVRALIDQLGIAMERALHVARLERLDRERAEVQALIAESAQARATAALAASVAHDLNHYVGLAALAVSVGERSPADAAEAMPRIAQALRAFGDLVERLQRAARPSHAGDAVADVARIIDDLAALLRPSLRGHHVELEVELDELPPVAADRVVVQQVLFNLLINARDALAASPRRTIRIRGRAEPGSVRVTVSDTGPGLAPEILERLFQPYATTKRDGHLGLGLASARSQLAQHGATIDAHNDGGAVFEIVLRASEPLPAPVALPHAPSPAPHARVLAVDDDPDVVYIIRAYLEPLGYEIATATSAGHALDAAASERFDLVLCDIGLPRQSGPEVCRLMRAAGYRGKFVLMTGWDTQNLTAEATTDEWQALLKKPFLGADLIQVIDAVLR